MTLFLLLSLFLGNHPLDCACDGCCVMWTGEPIDLTPVAP